MVIITNKKLKPRETNDFYPTPYGLAIRMCEKFIDRKKVQSVIDPGYGNGVFGLAVRDHTGWGNDEIIIDGVDIIDRELINGDAYSNTYVEDYLQFENPGESFGLYDIAIGNPPFKLAEEFVLKSYSLINKKGKVVFLLKLAFLESRKRANGLFKGLPPSVVYVLAGRPSFDGTGRSNDSAYAVFVWDKAKILSERRDPIIKFWDWK